MLGRRLIAHALVKPKSDCVIAGLRNYSTPSSKAFFSKLFDDCNSPSETASEGKPKSSSTSFADASFYELLRSKNPKNLSFNSRSRQPRFENNNNKNNSKAYSNNGFLRRDAEGVPIFAPCDLPQGSFKEVECFKHIIKKIYKEGNRDGLIQFMEIDLNGSDIPKVKFDKLLKEHEWNLKEYGLQVVSYTPLITKNQSKNHRKDVAAKIPLVKVVPKRSAMDKYNAELSKIKDSEIAMLNPRMAYILQQKNSSSSASASSSSASSGVGTKLIKISWTISDADLTGKKFSEIVSAAKKAALVVVVVDDKDYINRAVDPEDLDFTASPVSGIDSTEQKDNNLTANRKYRRKPKQFNELELLKREKTLNLILQLLEDSGEINCNSILKKGSLKERMLIKLKINKPKENKKKLTEEKSDNSALPKSDDAIDLNDENLDIMSIDLSTIEDKKLLKEIRKKQRKEKERLREQKKKSKLASA